MRNGRGEADLGAQRKKTPGGAGTHTRHTEHADAQSTVLYLRRFFASLFQEAKGFLAPRIMPHCVRFRLKRNGGRVTASELNTDVSVHTIWKPREAHQDTHGCKTLLRPRAVGRT